MSTVHRRGRAASVGKQPKQVVSAPVSHADDRFERDTASGSQRKASFPNDASLSRAERLDRLMREIQKIAAEPEAAGTAAPKVKHNKASTSPADAVASVVEETEDAPAKKISRIVTTEMTEETPVPSPSAEKRYGSGTLRSSTVVGTVQRDDGSSILRSVVTATWLKMQPLGLAGVAFLLLTAFCVWAIVYATMDSPLLLKLKVDGSFGSMHSLVLYMFASCKAALVPLSIVFVINMLILAAIAAVPRLIVWCLVLTIPIVIAALLDILLHEVDATAAAVIGVLMCLIFIQGARSLQRAVNFAGVSMGFGARALLAHPSLCLLPFVIYTALYAMGSAVLPFIGTYAAPVFGTATLWIFDLGISGPSVATALTIWLYLCFGLLLGLLSVVTARVVSLYFFGKTRSRSAFEVAAEVFFCNFNTVVTSGFVFVLVQGLRQVAETWNDVAERCKRVLIVIPILGWLLYPIPYILGCIFSYLAAALEQFNVCASLIAGVRSGETYTGAAAHFVRLLARDGAAFTAVRTLSYSASLAASIVSLTINTMAILTVGSMTTTTGDAAWASLEQLKLVSFTSWHTGDRAAPLRMIFVALSLSVPLSLLTFSSLHAATTAMAMAYLEQRAVDTQHAVTTEMIQRSNAFSSETEAIFAEWIAATPAPQPRSGLWAAIISCAWVAQVSQVILEFVLSGIIGSIGLLCMVTFFAVKVMETSWLMLPLRLGRAVVGG